MLRDVMVRAPGWYVRTASGWHLSRQRPGSFTDVRRYSAITLFHDDGSVFDVRLQDVFASRFISTEALVGGVWFLGGAIENTEGDFQRVPRAASDAGMRMYLLHPGGPDLDAAARVPGAVVHDDRGSNGGVTACVPLALLEDYREQVEWQSDGSN